MKFFDLIKFLFSDDVSQVISAVTFITTLLIVSIVGIGIYAGDFSQLKEVLSTVAIAVGGLLALARGRTPNGNGNGQPINPPKEEKKDETKV